MYSRYHPKQKSRTSFSTNFRFRPVAGRCLFNVLQSKKRFNYFYSTFINFKSVSSKDHNLPITKDITPLFSLNYSSSVGYLARASVNSVLQKAALSSNPSEEHPHDNIEETCKVS